MAYADITVNDPNPVKRWIQKQRFRDALHVLREAGSNKTTNVLDFGGGDGELVCQVLQTYPSVSACLYEPTPELLREAQAKLTRWKNIQITSDLSSIEKERFDFVFCLEVFEHLPHKATQEALGAIHGFLKPSGLAVIGVPHEIFAPALLKGVFRMARRYGAFDARPTNVLRAAMGRPPENRPSREITPGFSYHHYHLGFDYRGLERCLRGKFTIVSKWFSPARVLGPILNSEVYYVLRRANPSATT